MSKERDDRHRDAEENESGSETRSEVGYGKPPRDTRFKKGTSGNPKGRPRKPKPRPIRFSDAPSDGFFEEEAYRTITLRENGQPIKLPTTQAVMRSLAMEAIKGKRLSQKLYLERVEHAEEKHFRNKIERYVELKAHKRRGEQILAECERKGIAYPDDQLPHPEDIVLGPDAGEVSVTGPSTPEDVVYCEHTAAFRDHLLLRSTHARKMREGPRFGEGDRSICSFHFIAVLFDKWLPRRYRWRDGAEMSLLVEYGSLPRRQREKRIVTDYAYLLETMPKPLAVAPEARQRFAADIRQIFGKDWLSLPGKGDAGGKPAKT
mgnify:CR=1 FL=1